MTTSESSIRHFPEGFTWGAATAAYQIEGGWNLGGKSVSIWDAFTQAKGAGHVCDGSTGDVACDSYHRYQEDIALLKQLGVSSYRLSISWPRIIPDPLTGDVSPEGVAYYSRVIDGLLANGIQPCVTLYHWDLPLALEEKVGGWPREEVIPFFLHYAQACFTAFGDRVKMWITFNEPRVFIYLGYMRGYHAPGRTDLAKVGPYACAHNVIRAHAQVYRMYQDKFKSSQKGQVGIALNSDWVEPLDPEDQQGAEAAQRHLLLELGLFAHPIFITGDYPPALKQRLTTRAKGGQSRLAVFTEEEKNYVKGSADFLGLNYYTSRYIVAGTAEEEEEEPTYKGDLNAEQHVDSAWTRGFSDWLYSVPWGLRKLLHHVQAQYWAGPVFITENGFSDSGLSLQDPDRQQYLQQHLEAVHQAITEDGVDVRGYYCWSLMDNFEWSQGYTERFGLFHVDFAHPKRPRTAKTSVSFFSNVVKSNSL